MNRRRADAEIFLHVGFGRAPAVQPGIEVDKSQILPLFGREGFCRRTHAGHPIQLFVRASNTEARQATRRSSRYPRSLRLRKPTSSDGAIATGVPLE